MLVGLYPIQGMTSLNGYPWDHFLSGLTSETTRVIDLRSSNECPDSVVIFNRPRHARLYDQLRKVNKSNRVLVVMEPPVSQPSLHTRNYLSAFGTIFTASRTWAESFAPNFFHWPQDINPAPPGLKATADVSMVSANKRSAISTSLYGLRRSVLKRLDSLNMSYALYGPSWDASPASNAVSGLKAAAKALSATRPPAIAEALGDLKYRPSLWRGYSNNKMDAMHSAPISIIIENSADYVSEKLIDAIRAGTIPVYVGPNLVDYSIPEDLALVPSANPVAIVDHVTHATNSHTQEIVARGQAWLRSDAAKAHSADVVLFKLGQQISGLFLGR